MKWRYLGHLQLLSSVVAVIAEVEVSPQEQMANPQGMEVFAIERSGLPEDFVSFPGLCGNRRQSYLCRIGRLSGAHYYSGRHRERLCASGLRPPKLSAQVRRPNSYTSCIPAHMDAFITRTGRNG